MPTRRPWTPSKRSPTRSPSRSGARAWKNLTDHPDPAIAALARRLRVYTLGREHVSGLRFNPCAIQPGVSAAEAIADQRDLFEASHATSSTLSMLWEEVLERALFWATREGRTLTLADLEPFIEVTVRSKAYGSETSQEFIGALRARVRGWLGGAGGRVFQCRTHVPSIATLVDEGDTLIQTGAVSDRIAALVVLGLLQQIRRYIQLHPRPARSDGKPRLIIVIDEAHRLVPPLGRAGASETNADAVAFAAQMLVNFLTEIRAANVAVVIADQHPSRVDDSVIAAPTSHWIGQQAHAEDRQALEAAAGLTADQVARLPQLQAGEAFFRSRGYAQATAIQTFDFTQGHGLGDPPDESTLFAQIRHEPWFVEDLRRRTEQELLQLSEHLESLNQTRHTTLDRIRSLEDFVRRADKVEDGKRRREVLEKVRSSASKARRALAEQVETFHRRFYQPLIGEPAHVPCLDSTLRQFRERLIQAVEEESAPLHGDPLIARLDALSKQKPQPANQEAL